MTLDRAGTRRALLDAVDRVRDAVTSLGELVDFDVDTEGLTVKSAA